jgi:hypothetical protein
MVSFVFIKDFVGIHHRAVPPVSITTLKLPLPFPLIGIPLVQHLVFGQLINQVG